MPEAQSLPPGSIERDRWLDRLLVELLDLEGFAREALLVERCEGDEELEAEARGLLAAAVEATRTETSDRFRPVARLDALAPAIPESLGPYRVLGEIGRGGMGVVYLAERSDGAYEQKVAVKLLDGALRRTTTQRFLSERQILAELDHPGIARLLDGGFTEDGRPYFVMEFVEGRALDVYAEEEGLDLRQRIALMLELCAAVDAAHRALVVHRDIKPSNVLVDSEGRVRLLDFGIAKSLEDDGDPTRTATRALTPQYAAPEQYQGRAVTVASDVYQLGLLAYELVARSRPYDISSTTLAESVRIVCEQTPVPPSAVTVDGLEPLRISRDLDLVVMKALHKDPERRYSTVARFAEDLERYLTDQPVSASPDSWLYRARLFYRRNAVAVTSFSALLLLALLSGVWFLVRLAQETRATEEQARVAAEQRDRAEQTLGFLIDSFAEADPLHSPNPDMTARELLERGAQRLEEHYEGAPEDHARLLKTVATLEQRLGLHSVAIAHVEQALSLLDELPDADPADVLDTRLTLVVPLLRLDTFERAAEVFEEIGGREVVESLDEPALVTEYLMQRAQLHLNLGELESAEALFLDGIEVAEQNEILTGSLRVGLATIYRIQGRPAENVTQLEAVIAEREERYGDDHPQLIDPLSEMGNALVELGRLEDALIAQRRAASIVEARSPADHPKQITALNNLSIVYYELERYEEAEELQRRAVDRAREQKTPGLWTTLTSLANTLAAVEPGSREAEALHREARSLLEKALGKAHWQVALANNNLGEVLAAQQNYTEAEAVLQDCLDVFRSQLGAEHPFVSHPLVTLARVARGRGDDVEARRLLEEAVRIRRATYGPESTVTHEAEAALGALDA